MKPDMNKGVCLLFLSLLLMAAALSASAGTLPEDAAALEAADTLDRQLAILNDIAAEHAEELENGAWDVSLRLSLAPGLPEGLIPGNFDTYGYQKTAGFPEEARGHRFIALYSGRGSDPELAGDWLVRFPEEMRARSLSEAEYALVVEGFWTPSGYQYIPPATSSHRDYYGLVVDLRTGEATRFWSQRNSARKSGKRNELNGDTMSDREIWNALRSEIWGSISYPLADGTTLVFGITGRNCYLKGYEGKPENLTIPAEAEGHPVVEIGEKCFQGCKTLKSVVLPEGIVAISASAFEQCSLLEEINFPSTLKTIADRTFYTCHRLKDVVFPDGIRSIGNYAFYNAEALTEVVLPASLTSVGKKAFTACRRLSRAVIAYAMTYEEEELFSNDSRLTCVYVADGASNSYALSGIPEDTIIYAPEGSYYLRWAQTSSRRGVACESPALMPPVEYVTEYGMEFRLFEGEAALCGYQGEPPVIIVPEAVNGIPVTKVISSAIYRLEQVTSVTLPASVQQIAASAIYAPNTNTPLDIYITNPEVSIRENAIGRYGSNKTPVTIHAAEGSTAQRYVADAADERLIFEAWGEGVNPDARTLKNALALAEQVQQAAKDFWAGCNQREYSWLARVPGYDMEKPEAAAVLRLSREQFDRLSELMIGRDNAAKVFSLLINTQFNLPYARAAVVTARGSTFKAAPDETCSLALLCYATDLVLVTLDADGSGQAALICSDSDVLAGMTPEYVTSMAARYGIYGECSVYSGEDAAKLLAE